MNVLHLLGSVDLGGTEVLELDLLKNSKKLNWNFHVIISKGGFLEKEFLNESKSAYTIYRNKTVDKDYFFNILKFVKSNKIDVIHVHQYPEAFYAVLCSFFIKTKVVLTLHGHFQDATKTTLFSQKLIRLFCDKVIFVSKSLQNYYLKKHGLNEKKSLVNYNGIDISKLYSNNHLKLPFISDNDFVIGSVGNFNVIRNQMVIIKSIPKVIEKHSNAKFIFVGDKCPSNPKLFENCIEFCKEKDILNKNVFFLGRRNDVPDLLKTFDIFAYSSTYDTFGIALVEAMISGIPVIHNDLEALVEITEHGKYSSTYKSGNHEELAEKISSLLNNKVGRDQMSASAKEYATKKFSIESHAANLYSLYSDLLGVYK